MRSLNSTFSAFLVSVASATALSKALMPSSKLAMSSLNVAMASVASAMAFSSSDNVRSRPFFLSSAWSNCKPQYSFLSSSSFCSCLRTATMLSIILMTLSKPPWLNAFLPESATAIKSSAARSLGDALCEASRTTSKARARSLEAPDANWTKLAPALGNVFLNKSSASSSLRTLMVSAKATSSSARVFERSSHSAVFVAQFVSNSLRKFWSARSAASVSERSSFASTMWTPRSPMVLVLDSIEFVRAATSLLLADIISS
mmetsp:Transcript_65638/g.165390  ORF Transcript_65638/g.165390 Transcript_65638/m.165390 type:complete len:259 (-) Transcript_65638:808-1584(-)